MKIPQFEMERMQSTWENLVEMDMSESGVRPVTLRELGEMGLDLDAILDTPLGYSQSNGTVALREELARDLSRRDARPHRGHQRHLRGQLPARAQRCCATATRSRSRSRTTCSSGACPKSLGAQVNCFRLRIDQDWEPDWDEFERAVNREDAAGLRLESEQPDRLGALAKTPCAASWRAARRSARTCSPTKSIWARRSTARGRRASGG